MNNKTGFKTKDITSFLYKTTMLFLIKFFAKNKAEIIEKRLNSFYPDISVKDKALQMEIIYYCGLGFSFITFFILSVLNSLLTAVFYNELISEAINGIIFILIFYLVPVYIYLVIRTIPLIIAAKQNFSNMRKIYNVYNIEYIVVLAAIIFLFFPMSL